RLTALLSFPTRRSSDLRSLPGIRYPDPGRSRLSQGTARCARAILRGQSAVGAKLGAARVVAARPAYDADAIHLERLWQPQLKELPICERRGRRGARARIVLEHSSCFPPP